jgi:hypothetical protein
MMLPVFAAYLKEIESLHSDMDKILASLPQEALDWVPGPEMNSIAVLVAHTAGAERLLIGDIIGGMESHRDRPAEFLTRGKEGPALSALLAEALAATRATFEKLTVADLTSTEPRTKGERSFTVAAAIDRVVSHDALHLGHIELTRQLWAQRT